jgi:trk system potassium uptake protein TrkH
MAIALWLIYVVLTVSEIILLVAAGMSLFDAVNHAFATMATGGFSTKNTSIKYYDNLAVELILTFFMFVAGGNFGLYLLVWKKGFFKLFQDTEFKIYCLIIAVSTAVITVSLCWQAYDSVGQSLRDALFTVVSIITTTGFVTADFDKWPSVTKIVLLLLMFIGGCAGSTAGGIKVVRFLILIKDAIAALLRSVHPQLVKTIKIDHKPVDFEVLSNTMQFFFLYIIIFVISVLLVTATGLEPWDAMGAVAATLGNVGPGFGVVGPTTTFFEVSMFTKAVLTFDMLLGRLEIFTILVLFHPEFWQPYLIHSRKIVK